MKHACIFTFNVHVCYISGFILFMCYECCVFSFPYFGSGAHLSYWLFAASFDEKRKKFGMLMEFYFVDFFLFWQSLVRVLESSSGNTPCYSLVLFQDLLVSTSLSPVGLVQIYSYWIWLGKMLGHSLSYLIDLDSFVRMTP